MNSKTIGAALLSACLMSGLSAAEVRDFAKYVTLTVGESAVAEGTRVENVPVLVRLSTAITGFSYADVKQNGADLAFYADGDSVHPLPFEVDTWNPAGESLVWVRVPVVQRGTTIKMVYGTTASVTSSTTDVWTGYAGVWHLGEASGTAYDSTANQLNGAPTGDNQASMVAYADGAVGTARVNMTGSDTKAYLSIPNYNSLNLGGTFTISGWFYAEEISGYPRIFSRKNSYGDDEGFEIEVSNGSKVDLQARGCKNDNTVKPKVRDLTAGWQHLTFAYNGSSLAVYTNGVESASGTIKAATDNGKPLSVGCNSNGSETSFKGRYDEVRLYGAAASAERVQVEYAAMANSDFLTASAAGDLTLPALDRTASGVTFDGTDFRVAAALAAGSADGALSYRIGDGAATTFDGTAVVLTGLAADTTYAWQVSATGESGIPDTVAGALYTGALTAAPKAKGYQVGRVPALFTISRADTEAAKSVPLTINYAVTGTAGVIAATTGTVTIPAGAASVEIAVPVIGETASGTAEATLTLTAGLYGLPTETTVTVAVNPMVALSDFSHAVTLTMDPDYDDATLQNVVMPIRLSTAIDGFDYADCPAGTGYDLYITDATGHRLDYEVDTWNTEGTSLLWVKVPQVKAGEKLTLAYGLKGDNTAVYSLNDPKRVWSGWGVVCHGGLTDTGLINSVGNGITTTIRGNSSTMPLVSETPLGTGRTNSGTYVTIDNYNTLKYGSDFTVSCWLKVGTWSGNCYARFFSNMETNEDPTGFEIEIANSETKMRVRGSAKDGENAEVTGLPDMRAAYRRYDFVYAGDTCTVYVDGAKKADRKITTVKEDASPLYFLASADKGNIMPGEFDEMRCGPVLSADAIRVQHYLETNTTFVAFGKVTTVDETMFSFTGEPELTRTETGFDLSVTIAGGSGALKAVFENLNGGEDVEVTLSPSAENPFLYTAAVTTLAVNGIYALKVVGTSTGGTVSEVAKTEEIYNGAISVEVAGDAYELGQTPGCFIVSRPQAEDAALPVHLTIGGTAVAGTDYTALPLTVTIPAGEKAVSVDVTPLLEAPEANDATVTLTIAPGGYIAGATATMTLVRYHEPHPSEFPYSRDFTLTTYAGDPIAGLQALVKFDGATCTGLKDDSILYFLDDELNRLDYSVEKLTADGECLVWVKAPSFRPGLRVTMYWGHPNTGVAVLNDAAKVWNGYTGVWHLDVNDEEKFRNEVITTAPFEGSDAVTETLLDNGVRLSDGKKGDKVKHFLTVRQYSSLNVGDNFTVSVWFKYPDQIADWDRILSRKTSYDSADGWEITMVRDSASKIYASGSSKNAAQIDTFDNVRDGNWHLLTVVYNGREVSFYGDGVYKGTSVDEIDAAKDNNQIMRLGDNAGGSEVTFKGWLDEVRFAAGSRDAALIAGDYATVMNGFVAGDAGATDVTRPYFAEEPTLVETADGYLFTAKLTEGSGTLYAVYNGTVTNELVSAGDGVYVDHPELAAGAAYSFAVLGVAANGVAVLKKASETFSTDTISIAAGNDANEAGFVHGSFIVSRGDTEEAKAADLTVNYTIAATSTAQAGVNFAELPGSVTIPAGSATATIDVTPLLDPASTGDTTLTLQLAEGSYTISSVNDTASIAIAKLVAPEGTIIWIAASDSDGLASTASNWSGGRQPTAADKVVLDGAYSTKAMTWDGGVNGLTATVAGWEQRANYTSAVTIKTTYAEADSAFTQLAIIGDAVVNGGSWTHVKNGATQQYHLDVKVGGAFTLAAGAKLDANNKGYSAGNYPAGSACGAHAASADGYDKVYGDVKRPRDLGAGALKTRSGGGAIWLEVGGAATLNGEVNIRGEHYDSDLGAAGSFYVKAASCGGTGHIYGYSAESYNASRGSGGRVAFELTEAETLAFPIANIEVHGSCNSTAAGGGTIFVKGAKSTNGTLVMRAKRAKNYGDRWQRPNAITAIPAGTTWTFDAIEFRDYGMIAVPEGTTLKVTGGTTAITVADGERKGGIYHVGGTVDFGAGPYVINAPWIFQSQTGYTFDGNVTLKDGGAIGCLQFRGTSTDYASCDVTVKGNLTIEETGFVYADNGGPDQDVDRNAASSHGGQSGSLTEAKAYDSIVNPFRPGWTATPASKDRSGTTPGGGVVKLMVTGDLVNNGAITAKAKRQADDVQGSGGTINLTAATLSGTGVIDASVAGWSAGQNFGTGGGGRIAIRLTDQAIGTDGIFANIFAKGFTVTKDAQGTVNADYSSSAGTIYLEGKGMAEGAGNVLIANDGNTGNESFTVLPSPQEDCADELAKAKVFLSAAARVKLFDETKLREIVMSENTALDLNGRTLTVSAARINGMALKTGTYSGATLPEGVTDSSEGGEGTLVVKGYPFCVIIK